MHVDYLLPSDLVTLNSHIHTVSLSPFPCHSQLLIADHTLIPHGNLYTGENVATASNKAP